MVFLETALLGDSFSIFSFFLATALASRVMPFPIYNAVSPNWMITIINVMVQPLLPSIQFFNAFTSPTHLKSLDFIRVAALGKCPVRVFISSISNANIGSTVTVSAVERENSGI
jgi:hypothetical protein